MIVVLVVSNGQPASNWTVSPSVYLSISATVINTVAAFALQEGIAIAWWTKSIEPRAKTSDLHHIWAHGTSLRSALLSGRSFNMIAWATIAVTLAKVTGPLLQRASTVTTEMIVNPVSLTIPFAQHLPFGYTGIVSGHGYEVSFPTTDTNVAVNN